MIYPIPEKIDFGLAINLPRRLCSGWGKNVSRSMEISQRGKAKGFEQTNVLQVQRRMSRIFH